VRRGAQPLGLGSVWVVASHTHSGMGAYDERLISELAATGSYREDAFACLVRAAVSALGKASASLSPATLEMGQELDSGLVVSRDDGQAPDARLTRVVVSSERGPVAQLIVPAAHPTLIPKDTTVLDPDYPGRVAAMARRADGGVALVLQGGGGNGSARLEPSPKEPLEPVERFTQEVADAVNRIKMTPSQTVTLGYANARVPLPRPDSSRLVPWPFRAAGDNFLCQSAPRSAEVDALQLGTLRLLSIPGEPTSAAALELERAAGAQGTVSLANGYLGYVEVEARVRAAQGEASRQYFGPALQAALARAAALIARARP